MNKSCRGVVGSVTDRDGYPLQGIKVDLFAGNGVNGVSGDIVKTVRTDDAGCYQAKVPTDSYPGYALPTDVTGNHIGPAVEFTVTAGTTKVPTMRLYKAAIIRGTVTRNDGENSANYYASHCLDGSVPAEGEGCAKALDIPVKQGQVVTLDPQVLTHPGGQ